MDLPIAFVLGACGTCFGLCFLSGICPFVNSEIVVLSLVATTSGSHRILAIVVAATAGQMAGKSVMYWLGRGAGQVTGEGRRRAIERWRGRFERAPGTIVSFVLLSAITGIPPFYVVATLAGAFRTSFAVFLAVGATGRFLRFGLLALFPQALALLLRS